MKFKQRYKNNQLNTIMTLVICIVMLVFSNSIAYSLLNSTMLITGDAVARISKDIRITEISLKSTESEGVELYSPDYSVNTVKVGLKLPSLTSVVNYSVTIANVGDIDMTINSILESTSNNSNITYDIDFDYYSKILSNSTITINLSFRYADTVTSVPSNINYEATLYFDFDEIPLPTLASQNTWYKSTTYTYPEITSVTLVDEYDAPTDGTVLESWDASDEQRKGVMAYILNDMSLIISGNGQGVIYANKDSTYAFGTSSSGTGYANATFHNFELLDTSNVTSMNSMFRYAGFNVDSFNIDVTNYDTSKVTDMSYTFYAIGYSATSWSIGDVTNWNVSNVTKMTSLFHYSGFKSSEWSIGNLSNWDVSNVTNISHMFEHAGRNSSTWNIGKLDNWSTGKVTSMESTFYAAGYNLESWSIGDLSNWDTSKVENMSHMFQYAGYNSTTWSIGNLTNWNVSKVTDMNNMFYSAGKYSTSFDLGSISSWNVSNVTNMSYLFSNSGEGASYWNIGDLSTWDVSNVTNMSSMFAVTGYAATDGCDLGDLSNWDVSNVTNMASMFFYSGYRYGLKTFDMSKWDVSNVTNMSSMFMGIDDVDQLNIEYWDVSNVTDMSQLFKQASATTLDLSNWDVSKVTNMNAMFHSINNLTLLDLSGWNTSLVTDMADMFYNDYSLATIYISDNWTTSSVTSSDNMFYNTTSLPNFNSSYIDKTYAHGNTGGYMSNIIKFTIDGVTTIADKGMTWTEWLSSSYNTSGYVNCYCICTSDREYLIAYKDSSGSVVMPDISSSIIAGTEYYLTVN